jgi:Zn finger protein HypA/HybF involved in hydrogenase expression
VDKKHKKKLKRAAKKKKEKVVSQEAQIKMKKQMGMFDRLPESCSACEKEFPKTREAHMTWRVVVRNEKQQVRLFCPECQEKAKKVLENNNEV